MAIVLLNKSDQIEEVEFTLTGYTPKSYTRMLYTGKDPKDETPTYVQDDNGEQAKVGIKVMLLPVIWHHFH